MGRRSEGALRDSGARATRARRRGTTGVGQRSGFVNDQKFIGPVRCEKCGGNAHLIRRSPHPIEGLEIRTFQCHECGNQTKRVVSPQAGRMTPNGLFRD
jgi:hypothetical protein